MASKTFWLTSAAAAAFLIGAPVAGQVAANPIPPAATYADLLEPVPNAGARLAEDDNAQMQVAHLELAQYNVPTAHHHHHHHSARWYRSNGYRWSGGAWVLLPKVHHHHHHSRQWYSDNGYFWNGRAWVLRAHHHHHHHHQAQ